MSHAFQNTNYPICQRFFVSTPPYYLDWFFNSYSSVPTNQDDGPFCPQVVNLIQGTKPSKKNAMESTRWCSV